MKRAPILILFSILAFVAINTVFYFTIFNQQLEFQTDLIGRQIKVCGNTIEQEGYLFENELNSIPYQNDFTRLFSDEEIRQQGSTHLQQLYRGFNQLINKITVYDNQFNVYSLILDPKGNFVSDYYESQRQVPLNGRDELIRQNEDFVLTIPGFDESGNLESNILVDLNFNRFVKSIFQRYALEQTLWQTLIAADGSVLTTSEKNVEIADTDLARIGADILEESEGSLIHVISIDSMPVRVVSVYYPVRFVKRDLGLIFSMKTDLFLQSILIKIILVSVLSLGLIVFLLLIYFRVIKSSTRLIETGVFSEDILNKTIENLPLGLVFINQNGKIHLINRAALDILDIAGDEKALTYDELGLDKADVSVDDSVYNRTFGKGSLRLIRKETNLKHIYQTENEIEFADSKTKVVILLDVSLFESAWNLDKTVHISRTELLESMGQEIAVPMNRLQDTIAELGSAESSKDISASVENLQKSCSLLSNLIDATMDFACQNAGNAVTEEIPFSLRGEIDLALENFRGGKSNISIITKIRNEVPDDLVGDPFRLRQVFHNLINNALELTEDGRILISSEIIEHHAGILKIQFHIEDTGRGLPNEKITELMKYLDLGELHLNIESDIFLQRLSVARQHIELMKGQLWLSSPSTISTSPDHPGMKYTFSLEIFSGSSKNENLIFKEVRDLGEMGCLVLSQEKIPENELFHPLVEIGLNLKYLIYRKENFDSVSTLIAEKASDLHIVFIIHSEKEDGFLLAEELKKTRITDNQIMILLSSDTQHSNFSLSRNTGIEYYIEKPYESYLLVEILKNHFPQLDPGKLTKVPGPSKINKNLEVLLAEDNVFNRKVIQGLFKRLGCEIDQAKNGREAVEMVSKKNYDIIFMDLLMPEMDGLQAVAEIRKSGSKIPIIALTAVEDQESRLNALNSGFDDYLIKPASEESLRKIILQSHSKSG